MRLAAIHYVIEQGFLSQQTKTVDILGQISLFAGGGGQSLYIFRCFSTSPSFSPPMPKIPSYPPSLRARAGLPHPTHFAGSPFRPDTRFCRRGGADLIYFEVFSNIPSFYPLDAKSTFLTPCVAAKNIFKHAHTPPGAGAELPSLQTHWCR